MPNLGSTPRSSSALLLAALGATLAGCQMPAFEAKREVHQSESASGLTSVVCETHNGEIVVRGKSGLATVEVHAELRARGDTQQEAEQNCALLRVEVQRNGDRLVVRGIPPGDFDWRFSPSFAFVIEGPPALCAELTTHNGSVHVEETTGSLRATTHNGAVEARVAAPDVAIETHNGRILLRAVGEGALAGTLLTHNGSIDLELGRRSASVDASTHNGSIRTNGGRVVRSSDDRVRFEAGQGGGALGVTTHNGSINLAAGAN